MSLTKSAPRALGLCAALILAAACDSLNVVNPNAPHSKNDALQDPGTVKAIAFGAMRTWYLTSQGGLGPPPRGVPAAPRTWAPSTRVSSGRTTQARRNGRRSSRCGTGATRPCHRPMASSPPFGRTVS